MKRGLLIPVVCLVFFSITALAAPDTARVEKKVARLQEQLQLTADQTAQIREILLSPGLSGSAPVENRSGEATQREKKVGSREQDIESRIGAVLNDEQKAKYEQIINAPPPPRRGDRTGMLIERLHLNETQAARVREILDAAEQERQELRVKMMDNSSDRESMRQARRSIREKTESRLTQILTAEQMAEYQKFQQEMRRRRPPDAPGRGPR